MEKSEKFLEVFKRLASTSEHWLAVKKVLLEEIESNKEIIELIDRKVKENEHKISKLN